MRIAIDARELIGRPTGVGRYLAEILRAWAELSGIGSQEFVLCAPDAVPAPAGLNASMRTAPGDGTTWEQFVLPRLLADAGADVLFAPGYTAPLAAAAPTVVTVHDVSFSAHPEWFGWREGFRRRVLTRLTARKAARVITVSDFSKQEIVRHLGIRQTKVEVIYSGVTRLAAGESSGGAASASGYLPASGEAVVLFVGSLFNRRHVPELIAGFTRLAVKHPAARLELVGDNRTRPYIDVNDLIAKSSARERIRWREYVPDVELAALYARARAFAFLSSYEGFALTPLEALAAGIPVVLLDTEVAREIYGGAATYVGGLEPALIAEALAGALFDEGERERVLTAAAAQLDRYSWSECAHRTLQVVLSCARRR
jgi:glycosyltransferase involved in cell wall biosynthesis